MSVVNRRALLAGLAGLAGGTVAGLSQAADEPRVIEVVARRFRFEPNEIPLKAGEKVVIAFTSLDFVHGMNVPDLGLRKDLLPGRVTKLALQPQAPGVIDFLCDNFCGDGHETMHGRFVVQA